MKKFTSLLLLFLVCFMQNAGAQVVTAPDGIQFSTGSQKVYYRIQNTRSKKFVSFVNATTQLSQTPASSVTEANLFYFEEVSATDLTAGVKKVKIGSRVAEGYCAATTPGQNQPVFSAEGIEWYLLPINNAGFAISRTIEGTGLQDAWNDKDQTSVCDYRANDGGSYWNLILVDAKGQFETDVENLKNYYVGLAQGLVLDTEDAHCKNFVQEVNQITAEGDVTWETLKDKKQEIENFISPKFKAFGETLQSYYLKLSNDAYNGEVFYMSGTSARPECITEAVTPRNYWQIQFTEDKKFFMMYNPYFKKYMGAVPNQDSQQIGWANSKEEAGQFHYVHYADNNQLIAIIDPDNTNARKAIHHAGAHNLVTWGTDANASKWQFEVVEINEQDLENMLEKEAVVQSIKSKVDSWKSTFSEASLKPEGTPGYSFTGSENWGSWTQFLEDAKQSDVAETLQALKEKENKLDQPSIEANDVSGKFFHLVCSNRSEGELANVAPFNEGQSALGGRGIVHSPSANVQPMSALWTLEVVDSMKTRYYLKNVNSGLYFGELKGGQINVTTKEWCGLFFLSPYTVKAGVEDDWILSDHVNKGQFLCTQNPIEGNAVNHYIDKNDPGAGWKFEEVTSISINITDAKYATLNLPMAVEIANKEQLTAYIGKKSETNQNEFVLTKIMDGIIPANTAVVLQGEAGSYELNLNVTAQASVTDVTANELKGTTVEDRTFTADANYALGVLSDGTVGFKTLNRTKLEANKAYLPKAAVQGAAEMCFVFDGGEQTGINGVTAEAEGSNVYYDLNGRRVLYPTKGIYVNAKGQKVFLQ